MDIDVGQVIAGKYELVRLLGKGAMGEVWLATHNSLGGEFAIKLVEPADDMEAETAAGRFQLEAQIAAKLSRRTRHIVSVSDHGEENGLAYLVMELLEGESLEQRTKRSGPLDVPEVAAIVLQVARALSLAHEEGIFHRDLKPANVWLGRDEDGRLLVKLLDFGIARSSKPFRTRSPFATSKDMVLGTPSYMSPEQARGLDSLDYRCDLWALAVVAYEALTKRIPFEGETVEDIFLSICTFRVVPILARRPDLPPAMEAFFARAFAAKLDERFNSALELSDAFEQLVSPEALEYALGIPLTPSARRLEAAKQSNPQIAPLATPQPMEVQQPPSDPATSDPMVARSSSPDLNVALGGPTVMTRRRGNPNGGIFIAIAILAVFIAVGVLVLVFRQPSGSGKQVVASPSQPDPSSSIASITAVTTATTRDVPPPPPETAQETQGTKVATPPAPAAAPAPKRGGKPAPPPQPVAHPAAAPAPPPPAPPKSVAAPAPAPAKSIEKSGVF